MKITVTGVTHQQCGKDTRQGYQSVMSMHVQALRDLGHEVTQRPVELNDEAALESDLLIVGQVPWISIAAHHVFPVIDLLHRAFESGKRVIISVDDWQFPYMVSKLLTVARKPSRILRESVFTTRPGYEWASTTEGMDTVNAVIDRLLTGGWPDTMYPAFKWGQHRLLAGHLPARRHYFLDPTSYTKPYDLEKVGMASRKRRWVLGVLSDQDAWLKKLNLAWPVFQAGRPKSGAPALQEAELVEEYTHNVGVLSPLYKKIAGSGWWRNRFVYAAMAGSVLYADEEEVISLGDPYRVTPEDVENMGTDEHTELARAQAAVLRERCAGREEYLTQLSEMLRG